MAFKIKPRTEPFPWPVEVSSVAENGTIETQRFKGLFHNISTSEWERMIEGQSAYVKALEENESTDGLLSQRGMAERVWAGWPEGEILDDYGEPLPSNAANIAKLLEVPDVVQAVIAAWSESRDKSQKAKSRGRS